MQYVTKVFQIPNRAELELLWGIALCEQMWGERSQSASILEALKFRRDTYSKSYWKHSISEESSPNAKDKANIKAAQVALFLLLLFFFLLIVCYIEG